MVERVIVDSDGNVRLELRTPFSYIRDITDQVRCCNEETAGLPQIKTTNSNVGRSNSECSSQVLISWETWT